MPTRPSPPPNSWSTLLWAVMGRMYEPRKSRGFQGQMSTMEKRPWGVGVGGAPMTTRKRPTRSPPRYTEMVRAAREITRRRRVGSDTTRLAFTQAAA
jgi:hypothetical protein